MTYDHLLRRYIFSPAGMSDSFWNDVDSPIAHRANGYRMDLSGEITPAPKMDYIADLGSGDVLTTVEDLWRFDRALTSELLKEGSREAMWHSHAYDEVRRRAYGYGWEIYETLDTGNEAIQIHSHAGLALGFMSVIERIPSRDAFFAVILNVRPTDDVINNISPPDIRRIQSELRSLLLGTPVSPPKLSLERIFLRKYQETGLDSSLRYIDNLRTENPDRYEFDPAAFMLASYYVSDWGSPEDAISLVEYALQEDPQSWLLHESLGDFYIEIGNEAGALAAYQRALAIRPGRQYLIKRIEELQ